MCVSYCLFNLQNCPLFLNNRFLIYWYENTLFFCEILLKHKAVPATVAAAVSDVLSWQSLYLASICWFLEFFFFSNFLISETQVSKNYHSETLVFLITKMVFLHKITLKINQGSLWSIPNFWDSEISSNRSRYPRNQRHRKNNS